MGPGIHSSTKPLKSCSGRCAQVRATDLLVVARAARVVFGILLGILVRGDVVDVDVVLFGVERAPVFVGVIEARDRALLDRPARLVAFLLRLALVLRRRIGAEILGPRRGAAVCRPAAGTGPAE